jgi:hypothetical protein
VSHASSVLIALVMLLPVCGEAVPRSPPDPAAKGTLGSATTGATLNVEAYELGDDLLLRTDRLAVPSGDLVLRFTNAGTTIHDLFVYPMQDVSALLRAKRSDATRVNERAFLKDLVGMTGPMAPGTSTTLTMAALRPGLYELSSFTRGTDLEGSTYVSYDKGQALTLAVTGTGGPEEQIGTPNATIAISMTTGTYGSWLFVPDHLAAKAGIVTFILANRMSESHDLVISPIGDTSAFIAARLKGDSSDYSLIRGVELVSDVAPDRTVSKTLTLGPGVYVAACYMVGKSADGTVFIHADRGQRFVFVVY